MTKNHFPAAEGQTIQVAPGLRRRVGAYDDNLMCVEVHFDTGTVAPLHHHPHEQITYVVSGRFEFTVGDRTHVVGPGDSLYKQPGIVHGATCLQAGTLIDMFTPPPRGLRLIAARKHGAHRRPTENPGERHEA